MNTSYPHSKYRLALLITLLISVVAAAHAQTSPDLDKVLRQMDAASAKFQTAQAEFQWDQFEKVVSSTDTQKGTIYFERKGANTNMSAQIRDFNGKPAPKTVVYKDGTLYLYQPNINQVTIFSAGANREQYEGFLTLGFGGSGRDLEKNWDVTYQGTEQINSTSTVKLALVAKQASIRNMFAQVVIWIDPTRAISLKQQFTAPSGDIRTATYTSVQAPAKLPTKVFDIDLKNKQVVRK